MKQTCAECHFLAEYVPKAAKPFFTELAPGLRQQLMEGKTPASLSTRPAACYFGVWNPAFKTAPGSFKELIFHTDRKDCQYYWQHREGMLFDTAAAIHEREEAAAELRRDRRLTIWGLWIAAGALVVSAILGILDRLCR